MSRGAVPHGPLAAPPRPIQPRGLGSIMPPAQQPILWAAPVRKPVCVQSSFVAPLRSPHSMPSLSSAQHMAGAPMKSPAASTTPLFALNFT